MRVLLATLTIGALAFGETGAPHFAERAPQSIGLLVVGVDEPSEKVESPKLPEVVSDTELPAEGPDAELISSRISTELVSMLERRGYRVERVESNMGRVREYLRLEHYDALLVVLYRPAFEWPLPQQTVDPQGRTASSERAERGLSVRSSAVLMDSTTRLWLWRNPDTEVAVNRVESASYDSSDPAKTLPLADLADILVRSWAPSVLERFPRRVAKLKSLTARRAWQLWDRAEIEHFRGSRPLLLQLGGGYGRRPFDLETHPDRIVGGPRIDADEAFGGHGVFELAVRQLGDHLLHGFRLSIAVATSHTQRTLGGFDGEAFRAADLALERVTSFETSYTVSQAWMPHPRILLAAGVGPEAGIVLLDAGSPQGVIDREGRVPIGVVSEIEALYIHQRYLVGPVARLGYLYDVLGGSWDPTWTASLRVGYAL